MEELIKNAEAWCADQQKQHNGDCLTWYDADKRACEEDTQTEEELEECLNNAGFVYVGCRSRFSYHQCTKAYIEAEQRKKNPFGILW